ncbi:MAG: acetate uptake transporter [Parasporobacterium sp.]|nr:acetate uptake transporter [Parasporobacterium sp.]
MSENAKHKIANASPLGLLGFGTTTVLLNLSNAGIIPMSVVILAMGIALGGLAQVIAGIMEFKAGNTFGATAFTAYGLFWWSLVLILTNPLGAEGADEKSLGFYMLLWFIFTAFMFIGTLKAGKALRVVFFTLALLFLALAIEKFTGSEAMAVVAGVIGIICGLSAIYTALAEVLNETFGRKVMPV